jgi:hypothetical protein
VKRVNSVIISRDDFVEIIDQILDRGCELNGKTTVIITDDHLKQVTNLQVFSQKSVDNVRQIVKNIIYDYALRSELKAPGTFETFLYELKSKTISTPTTQVVDRLNKDFFQNHSDKLLSELRLVTRNMLNEALSYSGVTGKILLSKSQSNKRYLLVTQGHEFFFHTVEASNIRLDNPNILCVSGHLERISELNLLFTQFASLREPLVIFARKFSEEVIQTVKLNNKKNILNVSLVEVPAEIDTINSFADLAVVCNNNVFTPDLGRLLLTLNKEDCSVVDSVEFNAGSVLIKNISSEKSVATHVSKMLEQLSFMSDIKQEIYSLRLKSLSSKKITIGMLDDEFFVKESQIIDRFLRSFYLSARYGTTPENFLGLSNNVVLTYVSKCRDVLNSIGAVLFQESIKDTSLLKN